MPARPLSDETLQLIAAVREALVDAGEVEVEEKRMFGCHVFMVNGKLCLGVEGEELLVRLPPSTHAAVAETPGLRPLSSQGQMDGYFYVSPAAYATRAQWQHWITAALAFNPLAKATRKKAPSAAGAPDRSHKESALRTPSKRKTAKTPPTSAGTKAAAPPAARRHSVFDDDT